MSRRKKRPAPDRITQIQRAIRLTMPKTQGAVEDREPWKRRMSTLVAAQLRREGLLDAEGYAPGSWAAVKL